MAKKKTYAATAQVVCVMRGGSATSSRSRTSIGLSSIDNIRASTKLGAQRQTVRTWRSRGELPVPGMKRRASCTLHPSVEEV